MIKYIHIQQRVISLWAFKCLNHNPLRTTINLAHSDTPCFWVKYITKISSFFHILKIFKENSAWLPISYEWDRTDYLWLATNPLDQGWCWKKSFWGKHKEWRIDFCFYSKFQMNPHLWPSLWADKLKKRTWSTEFPANQLLKCWKWIVHHQWILCTLIGNFHREFE